MRAIAHLIGFLRLPSAVRRFYGRAVVTAIRTGHYRALTSATHPRELAVLVRLAEGRRSVVELGTGGAWTSISLALARDDRRVVTYDFWQAPERHQRYLDLVDPGVRARITFREAEARTAAPDSTPIDFLFIDASHEREDTIETFRSWEPIVEPEGVIVFHDYGNPSWPGVEQAVSTLGLSGEQVASNLFVWRKPAA